MKAFGTHPLLREVSNLVIVAGTRDNIDALAGGARRVWEGLIKLVDTLDLYGHGALGGVAWALHALF